MLSRIAIVVEAWLRSTDDDYAGGGQKYHVTWRVQAEICPNKAWKPLLGPPAFQLKDFVKPSGNHYAQDQAKMM